MSKLIEIRVSVHGDLDELGETQLDVLGDLFADVDAEQIIMEAAWSLARRRGIEATTAMKAITIKREGR